MKIRLLSKQMFRLLNLKDLIQILIFSGNTLRRAQKSMFISMLERRKNLIRRFGVDDAHLSTMLLFKISTE